MCSPTAPAEAWLGRLRADGVALCRGLLDPQPVAAVGEQFGRLLAQARPNREDDAIGHRHVPILVIDLVCRVDNAAPSDEQVARG